MSDNSIENVQFATRLVPDERGGPFKTLGEAHAAGHDTLSPTTGTRELGVVIDGAFIALYTEAEAQFQHLLERAKSQQQDDGDSGSSGGSTSQ
jgi:hypothetical protein